MPKSLGIIGYTGRMGLILTAMVERSADLVLGSCYSQSSDTKLRDVFIHNDYVIDFSSATLISEVLTQAIANPKPIVICTTGWDIELYKEEYIVPLSQKVPIIIAPNTSFGAYIQKYITNQLSKIFGEDYDIDITDKHHKHKKDIPSGTANDLLNTVKSSKNEAFGLQYESFQLDTGHRPKNFIGMHAERSGNRPGEHEVTFINENEMIAVKHTVFNRNIFAQGALTAVKWLDTKPTPGIYTMADVIHSKLK